MCLACRRRGRREEYDDPGNRKCGSAVDCVCRQAHADPSKGTIGQERSRTSRRIHVSAQPRKHPSWRSPGGTRRPPLRTGVLRSIRRPQTDLHTFGRLLDSIVMACAPERSGYRSNRNHVERPAPDRVGYEGAAAFVECLKSEIADCRGGL